MTRTLWQNFVRAQQGSVLMLTGLGMLFLVGIGGAGYDLGRQQLVRQKIQQASDAAALAAAGMDFGTSNATRQNTAQAFFALNYPNDYLGVARPTPSISIAGESITVSATSSVPTSFVGNFGVSSITAAGSTSSRFKRLQTVIDVILVMDNSGSMGLNSDVGAGNTLPASSGVRTACRAGWASYIVSFNAANGTNFAPYSPAQVTSFCNAREGATGLTRINALRYSATELTNTLMNPNPLGNRMALVIWDDFLISQLDFTNDPNIVKNRLNVLYGRAGTDSTVGLQSAQLLSSSFRASAAKAVILMTDGLNGEVLGDIPATLANQAAINPASLALCNALKENGILVYTVGFGTQLTDNSTASVRASQFLSDCATGPNGPTQPNLNQFYFRAPDAATLANVFNQISGSLQRVKILQ